jgi:hypothetical protein
VIRSLQNLLSETQAQSRLAMLRQDLGWNGTRWHRSGYSLASLLLLPLFPFFGGIAGFVAKPACRMPAASLTAARNAFGDTSVHVQEGSP